MSEINSEQQEFFQPNVPQSGPRVVVFFRSLIAKIRARIQERHYLFRLIVAVIALALMPYIISLVSMLRYSYHEMEINNEQIYSEAVDNFAELFSDQVNEYLVHAAQISSDSRNPARAANTLQMETILPYPSTYPKVIRTINQYNPSAYDYAIYFPNHDALFTTQSKYTALSYMHAMSLENTAFSSFLIPNAENASGIRFCAIYDENDAGKLYIGIPTTIGNLREPALIFYTLDAMNTSRISSSAALAQWSVLDSDGTLIYCTGKRLIPAAELNEILTSSPEKKQFTTKSHYIFRKNDAILPYTFVEIVPLDAATVGLLNFYAAAWKFLIVNVVMFVLLLILLLYISYRPVKIFLEKIVQGIHPFGEFETIRSMFEKMNRELSERDNMVLDFLLNNLLYGLPVPEKEAERFGIPTEKGYFRVFVLSGAQLDSTQRTEITKMLRDARGITAFITDILGEPYTVLICLSEQPEVSHSLTRPINEWLHAHFADYELRTGEVMDSINRIRDSYLSCFPQPEPETVDAAESIFPADAADPDAPYGIEAPPTEQMQRVLQLKAEVEAYIRTNFRDPMISQTAVADHFKISVYSLSRLFKKHIGIGFTEFITGIRLEEAQALLLKTDMTIGEISTAVGMPNSNYFSRLFKATYLVTPAQFRKKNIVTK